MSSETNKTKYPNDGLSAYSDIRLAYYIYTWDSEGKLKQKTAWSSIGTYTLNNNDDIVYNSNKNQLIKTNGSNGITVVGNDFGVIVNDGEDVGPTLLRINGKYIVGLDNISNGDELHYTISTVDPHTLKSNDMNTNNVVLSYTDMWSNNKTFNLSSNSDYTIEFPFLEYSKNTVVEPVEIAVIGKESNGINGITNRGFIYNNIEYNRNISIINYYTDLWNYFKDWEYGSNALSVDKYGKNNMTFSYANTITTSNITSVNDFDITIIRGFSTKFGNLYSNLSGISGIDDNKRSYISVTCEKLSNIADTIDDLMGNKLDYGSRKLQTPITSSLINLALISLQNYSNTSNITDLWELQNTAIAIEKLPVNSTFIDFTERSNATSIIGMNNKTKQWVELQLPTLDQTYDIILRNVLSNDIKNGDSGSCYSYSLLSLSKFINQYSINFARHGDGNSNTSMINYLTDNDGNSTSSSFSNIKLIDLYKSDDNSIHIGYTSYSYLILDNNLQNSPSTYRFIGIESKGGGFSNDQGSNTIKLTGFNKILLNDLYENPNTYQDATITYYYGDEKQTTNILEIDGTITSYTVSLSSAIKRDQNVLIGGCGSSDDSGHTIGAPGVFYIPLPSEIDMDDNSAYVDTHWMLTTWTPNISNGALTRGIINNQDVLYKYTKMNDLITTGLYGGFTPYYNPNNNITAGVLRIPQISYGNGNYGTPIYVTSYENQIAKLNKIMYSTGNVTLPDDDGKIYFYNNSFIQISISDTNSTPIGNIAPSDNTQGNTTPPFKTYFDSYQQFAACVFTLNSNEKNIILKNNMMGKNEIGNVAYLDLIGYPDEEFDNLSFDVDRKYIFTFNAHIQVTNLNLMTEQINYGTPSLLLIGHFRNRYCKANSKININGNNDTNIIYPGRNIFIPLLNKPLENPVNNIYNVEGTYTLSWNTTGDSINEFNDITDYEMYIPKEAKSYKVANGGETLQAINTRLFKDGAITNTTSISEGNILHFENVLDRIYAFILTGETVNNNFMYQFVNNTTYQNNNNKILSNDDINLITGKINGNTVFTTSGSYSDNKITIKINSNNNDIETIECTLNDSKFTSTINLNTNAGNTNVVNEIFSDNNAVIIKFENKPDNISPLLGIEITAKLIKDKNGTLKEPYVETYDNHLSFDNGTGIDSGILGINEPMLSMTIQRY